MDINEEQKLIILGERHLIVKQNIHKSFLKKAWSTSPLSVENTSTSVYYQLKLMKNVFTLA